MNDIIKKKRGELIMRAVIDRIEEGKAVLLIRPEEKNEIYLPKDFLPEDAEEGSILKINLEIDQEATKAAEKRVKSLLDKLKDK